MAEPINLDKRENYSNIKFIQSLVVFPIFILLCSYRAIALSRSYRAPPLLSERSERPGVSKAIAGDARFLFLLFTYVGLPYGFIKRFAGCGL